MSTFSGNSESVQVGRALAKMERKRPETWSHLSSHELLAGRRELVIMHSGELYLLKVTRKGKLILTK